jgi:hypothetical protein
MKSPFIKIPGHKPQRRALLILILAGILLHSCNLAPFDMKLKYAIAAVNKKCPQWVDKETRCDSARALKGPEAVYYYTLVKVENPEQVDIPAFEAYMKPEVLYQVKTNKAIKPFLDNNTIITYSYNDKNGRFLSRFSLTPEMYHKDCPKPLYHNRLVYEVATINKTCPKFIDKETRIDSVKISPDSELSYFFSLINVSKSKIDIEKFEDLLRPSIIKSMKTNSEMQGFRDNRINLGFYYNDQNGELISKIGISPEDYADSDTLTN